MTISVNRKMNIVSFVVCYLAACCVPSHARRLSTNQFEKTNYFKLVEQTFLADKVKLPFVLPIIGGVYTENEGKQFGHLIDHAVDAFLPYIKDFTYYVNKHFDVAYLAYGRSSANGEIPAEEVNVSLLQYNVQSSLSINMTQTDVANRANITAASVFSSFCYPPRFSLANITIIPPESDALLMYDEGLSGPCHQSSKQWNACHASVKSIDKYTSCQYVVDVSVSSTNVYVEMHTKFSGVIDGSSLYGNVHIGVVVENQIPSKLRISVNDDTCDKKQNKHTHKPYHYENKYEEEKTYVCLENGYWKPTNFYVKDCYITNTNAPADTQKEICKAYKKILKGVDVSGLQPTYNYEFPQKLPKCYPSWKIYKMSKKSH